MVVVGAHIPWLERAVYICCSLRHGPSHQRAAGCLAGCPGLRGTRLVFFFLRRTHKYCSIAIGFFSFAIYTSTAHSVPFFSTSPTAHLKSSPSNDESESKTFIFRRFWGRVHDTSSFLRGATLSKGRVRSAPDDASVGEEEEEEEEVDEEGSGTLAGGVAEGGPIATSTSSFCCASSPVFFFLHPSCAVQAKTTSRSEGGAQRLPGGDDIRMLCIEVHLHAVQPYGGLTKGAMHRPVCAQIACRSLGHRPPRNVSGLQGTICQDDGNKLTLAIAEQFCGAFLTSTEAAFICNTLVPQDVPPHMSPHAV